jgi:hypothetical protein
MNAMAEALGMALPGSASIPAPYRERGACAYQTGQRIVQLVLQDVKPSDIMTKEAFENAIALCTAIGGSTNAPIHLNAVAKHIGVELNNDDWERVGYELPLLVNIQPAGQYLCEEYHRAGGLPCELDSESVSRAPRTNTRHLARAPIVTEPADTTPSRRSRAAEARQAPPPERAHRLGQVHRRQLPRRLCPGPPRHPPLRQAAHVPGGFPPPQGHPLRQRHHEDLGHLPGL